MRDNSKSGLLSIDNAHRRAILPDRLDSKKKSRNWCAHACVSEREVRCVGIGAFSLSRSVLLSISPTKAINNSIILNSHVALLIRG
jgi:hypothetical protein